jgi:hypothetical protein
VSRFTTTPQYKAITSAVSVAILSIAFVVIAGMIIVQTANGVPTGVLPGIGLLVLVGMVTNGLVLWRHRQVFVTAPRPGDAVDHS